MIISFVVHCLDNFIPLYRKVPKFWDARNLCCNLPKIQKRGQTLWVFCQNGANGIANSEDPDQTAPLGAVLWSLWNISLLYITSLFPDFVFERIGLIILWFLKTGFLMIMLWIKICTNQLPQRLRKTDLYILI